MPSEVIWGTLAGLFIAAIYLVDKIGKRKVHNPSATWIQKHTLIVGGIALAIPIAVVVILVNTVFGKTTVVRKVTHGRRSPASMLPTAPAEPAPVLKLVISDGSQETNVSVLNRCAYDEVTLIQNGTVQCVAQQSPQVTAWMADLRMQEQALLRKYVEHQTKAKWVQPRRKKETMAPMKGHPPVMKQGLFLFAQASTEPKVETKKETKQKPFRSRHAEIFYFLALVLGVLGKYFWDHYEDKKIGKGVKFEPHLIVMSFIIAALVYYSIQQGIEKEASKFTTRGVVFAFNSGFMWQTILTSMNRSRNGQAPAATVQPSE